jgi:hypothetical protein
MSDPNSTSTAGLTWAPLEPGYVEHVAENQPTRALLLINVCGFLMGYYAMPNQWFQIGWLACLTLPWLLLGGMQQLFTGLTQDVWLRCVIGLISVMVIRSSMFDSPGMGIRDLWAGWMSSGLLICVMMVLWQVGTVDRAFRIISTTLAATAALAAFGSMAIFYVFDERAVFGLRLTNWFVYGGWNSVCTGMTFGFAAVWAINRWCHAAKRLEKVCFLSVAIFLIWATLLSMSRGALLALVAGHVGLIFSRGWRLSLRPVLLLIACIGCFQILAPQISKMGVRDLSEHLSRPKLTEEMVSDGVIASNPAKRLIMRGDSHRFSIYAAGFHSMTTPSDWLIGKGLWSSNDRWSCSLPWNPEHLHSVFVDTLVRGGVLALASFFVVLVWGLFRAWFLAQQGEDVWMMLGCFGVAGLIFDGDSAFSLLSVPRFETLILWVPLVFASARYTILNRESKTAVSAQVSAPL